MAKPSLLQHLKNGLILCKKNFPQFVDTWNWLVNRTNNIKGDADIQGQMGKGLITVDNTDSEHPVIRFIDDGRITRYRGDADISSYGEGFYNTKSIRTVDAYDYDQDLSGNSKIKVYQLNNFGIGGKVNPILSSDDVLVRRNVSGNYNLEYVSMSKLSVGESISGDSDLYPCTYESIQSCESDGQRYLELFEFDSFENHMDSECVRGLASNSVCDSHVGGILIRENTDASGGEDCAHTLKYADIRDIYPYADSDYIFEGCVVKEPFSKTNTKSIEKNGHNLQKNVFQLYGFDWGSDEDSRQYVDFAKKDDYCAFENDITGADLILRRTTTGEDGCDKMILMYTDINRIYVHADTEKPFDACGCHNSHTRSIDVRNWCVGSNCVIQYHTLHGFSNNNFNTQLLSSGMDILVRKHTNDDPYTTSELNYVPISSFQISSFTPDSCVANCTRSIAKDGCNGNTIRLYDFDQVCCNPFPSDWCNVGVLCRHTVCGDQSNENHLEYYELSNFLSGGSGGGTPDSCIDNCTKSLEKNNEVLRLYNFGRSYTDFTSEIDLSASIPYAQHGNNDVQFICRENGILKYSELKLKNGVCFKGNACATNNERTGMHWTFESASDSNIKVEVVGSTIRIGAYYL